MSKVVVNTCNGTDRQQWRLKPIGTIPPLKLRPRGARSCCRVSSQNCDGHLHSLRSRLPINRNCAGSKAKW